jgi:hypothetical protein
LIKSVATFDAKKNELTFEAKKIKIANNIKGVIFSRPNYSAPDLSYVLLKSKDSDWDDKTKIYK